MVRTAGLALAVLAGTCDTPDDQPSQSQEVAAAPADALDYSVMFMSGVDDASRRALKPTLDRFREIQDVYFLGEVYQLDPPSEFLLVFTPRGGQRSREVGFQILDPQADVVPPAYWTGIVETAEGVFSVLELLDLDGQRGADVVYCRWDGAEPKVEVALRRDVGWRVEQLPPREDCRGGTGNR